MSQETLKLLQGTNTQTLEMQLAMQCAPVISGLKVSNLFITQKKYRSTVRQILQKTDLSCCELLQVGQRITFLLYRHDALISYLSQSEVMHFLKQMGYENASLTQQLQTFRTRYQKYMASKRMFPHEMGLFLGYPIEDVKGFIENNGANSLYTGYWKVYSDMQAKITLFQKFELARDTLVRLVLSDIGMADIILNYNLAIQTSNATV